MYAKARLVPRGCPVFELSRFRTIGRKDSCKEHSTSDCIFGQYPREQKASRSCLAIDLSVNR
jgi:hypothetical protein